MDSRNSISSGWVAPSTTRLLLIPDPEGNATGGVPVSDAAPNGEDLGGVSTPETESSAISPGATTTTAATDPTATATTTAPGATAPGDGWQSIREAAKAFGYSTEQQFEDDRSFLMHLLGQAQQSRQADFYARLGQQLAPHAAGIQGYLNSQQTRAQQPAEKPWEAPEFDERWLNLVDRDPATGIYLAKPGVSPEVASKVNAFADWKQTFDRNPAQVLNSMVEQRAKDIAAQVVREQLATQSREQAIRQIVGENQEWLYQKDAQGQVMMGLNGPMVTPVGARYLHHLQAVKAMGVADPRHQDGLAKSLVRAEFAAAQQAGTTQQQQQGTNPQTTQAGVRPNVNPLQVQPPETRRVNPAATEPSVTGRSLRELLQAEFAAEGVTDADFASIGS